MVQRMTLPTRFVLQVLLEEPDTESYGLDVARRAGLATGTVHPILARLEAAGWLVSRWEEVDPAAVGRPARRLYRLTQPGALRAQAAVAKASPLHVLRSEAYPS